MVSAAALHYVGAVAFGVVEGHGVSRPCLLVEIYGDLLEEMSEYEVLREVVAQKIHLFNADGKAALYR